MFCFVSAWEENELASQYGTVLRGSGCWEGSFTSAQCRPEKRVGMPPLCPVSLAPFYSTNKRGAKRGQAGRSGAHSAPSWPLPAPVPLAAGVSESSLHPSLPSCTFRDPTWGPRSPPWWEYFHHGNREPSHKPGQLGAEYLSAHAVGCTHFSSQRPLPRTSHGGVLRSPPIPIPSPPEGSNRAWLLRGAARPPGPLFSLPRRLQAIFCGRFSNS